MWANSNCRHPSIYAYIRWDKENVWLIIVNFNDTLSVNCNIYIPEHFWELTKNTATNKKWQLTSMLRQENPFSHTRSDLEKIGVPVSLPAHSSEILSIKAL
jgi:hypothetical protein